MTDRWLVEISGLRLGPLERADIQQMLDSGELRLDDRVCPEDSDDWQLAEYLYDDDGDQLLGDPVSHAQRSVARQPTSLNTGPDHQWDEAPHASGLEPEPAGTVATAVTREPMFYVQRDGDEVGPLPLSVMHEFSHDGLLNPDTPVRSEDDAAWTTAEEYGFEFPVVEVETPDSVEPKAASAQPDRLRGSALWIVFAPFFFALSAGQTLSTLSRRQMLVTAAVLVAVGAAGVYFGRIWSQTALTGQIRLDGEPLANVVILLTGTETGDSGMGVSGSNGHVRVVTLDGALLPGDYTVTVDPLSTDADNDAPEIPERYSIIGLSDAIIEVTEATSTCDIELTSKRRLKRGGGYLSSPATGASVLE